MTPSEGIDKLKELMTNGLDINGTFIKPFNPIKIEITIDKFIINVKFLDKKLEVVTQKQIFFIKPKIAATVAGFALNLETNILTVLVEGWPDLHFEYT